MRIENNNNLPPIDARANRNIDTGFSLIEVVIALVIIMIVMLGAFAVLAYAVNYNAGNKMRAQAVAIMQQEVERYRSAKFNSTTTDNFASPADPDRSCVSTIVGLPIGN